MKFIIGVDCEGVACAVGSASQPLGNSSQWSFIAAQATREANAAAVALFDAGATEVIIWDNHMHGTNLDYDRLDKRCRIACGFQIRDRWPGMDSDFAGALMIGYHAMDNTTGVLAHTYSSGDYQWIKANGVEVGEMEIDAALAGEKGVPVIFVASDDIGTAEAKKFMPWVQTVQTKQARGRHRALSLHPQAAVEAISAGVAGAVKRLGEMKPFTFTTPVTLEYRFKILATAERQGLTGWQRTDPYTCSRTFDKLSDEY